MGDWPITRLGFGAAAWKAAPRDTFIGWSQPQREQHLHLVVNNARFLIVPWVRSRNLASTLLALTCRRLPHDWEHRYGHCPVLAETFVQPPASAVLATKSQIGSTSARLRAAANLTAIAPPNFHARPSGSIPSPTTIVTTSAAESTHRIVAAFGRLAGPPNMYNQTRMASPILAERA